MPDEIASILLVRSSDQIILKILHLIKCLISLPDLIEDSIFLKKFTSLSPIPWLIKRFIKSDFF